MDRGDDPSQEGGGHGFGSNTSAFGFGDDGKCFDFGCGISEVVCSAQDDERFEPLGGRKGEINASDVHGVDVGAQDGQGLVCEFIRFELNSLVRYSPPQSLAVL